MPRKRKRADNFSDLTPETFRRDDAGLDEEPVDSDFTLIADYWKQVLPPAEMEEVTRRLCTDDAFYEKVGPGLIALEFAASQSEDAPPIRDIVWAGDRTMSAERVRQTFAAAIRELANALRTQRACAVFAAKLRRWLRAGGDLMRLPRMSEREAEQQFMQGWMNQR